MANIERTLFEIDEARQLEQEQETVTADNWPELAERGFIPTMDLPHGKRRRELADHLKIERLRREHDEVLVGDRFNRDADCPEPCPEFQTVYVR